LVTIIKNNVQTAIERKDNFKPDPKIRTSSGQLHDYKASGYDRVHLDPRKIYDSSKC
jgi:DNA/RNA endonuclease G (NUC1)